MRGKWRICRPNMREQVDQICVENCQDAHGPVNRMLMPGQEMLLKRSKLMRRPPCFPGYRASSRSSPLLGVGDVTRVETSGKPALPCHVGQRREGCTLKEKREIVAESFDQWLPLSG